MPTYTVTTVSNLLNAGQKSDLAQAITRAHAEITGAPPSFAQVMFDDRPKANIFIGGKPLDHAHLFVFGHIRDGRAAVDRKRLILRIAEDVARLTGLPQKAVWVYLHELPAPAMIEFGHILPQAGDEAAWTSALPPELRSFLSSLEAS